MFAYLLILVAACLWALVGLFVRELDTLGVAPLDVAFWRAVLGGVLFVGHAAATGRLAVDARRDLVGLAGFGLIGVTLFFAAFNMAIATGGVSLAVVLLYSAPAFVVVLARIFLGEAITAAKLASVGLVVAGVVLVSTGGQAVGVTVDATSITWGVTAALAYSSFYIYGKRVLARYRPVTIFAFAFPVGALGLAPFVDWSSLGAYPTRAWWLIGGLTLLSTYLASLAYYTALRHMEASRAVLVASLEPVIAAGLAALVFGERLGLMGLAGAALVITGSAVAALAGLRRRRPLPAAESTPDGD